MNLYLRLLALMARYALGRTNTLKLHEECLTRFAVMPTDLDTNVHMNNGRYLTLMDLGRLDFMAQAGLLWPTFRRGIVPVLGASQMSYFRPLLLWQSFQIGTRLLSFDDKWFVIEQRFIFDGHTVARGYVRGIFRRGKQTIAPAEVMQAGGQLAPSLPPLPPAVRAWLDGLEQGRQQHLANRA